MELQAFMRGTAFYRAYAPQPADVVERSDGKFYRVLTETTPDGTTSRDMGVCEDCWTVVPRYVSWPRGLVSPESDGDAGGNFKKARWTVVGDKPGLEALQKIVCLPCFLQAYARTYPGAPVPVMSDELIGGGYPVRVEPPMVEPFIPEPGLQW